MATALVRLTASQLSALPREKTAFFFAVGPLEDHGPHLPLGLDVLEAAELCRRAAERLEREMPGWHAVIMPAAPLGLDSNTQAVALTVRAHVLRDWLVDACRGLERAGFCHFVCFTGHLGAKQLTAIEEAGAMIRKRTRWIRLVRRLRGGAATAGAGRDGKVAPLPALVSACSALVPASTVRGSPLFLDAVEHGGRRDTSVALALGATPAAAIVAAADPAQLPARAWAAPSHFKRAWLRVTRKISGYWGKPAEASPAWGEGVLQGSLDEIFPKLRAVLEGADPDLLFRSWYSVMPPNRTFFKSWLLAMSFTLLLLLWLFINLSALIGGEG
jgi:creatinine amidohydrolase/Fe(II)-dependent formamide hydrolase-like protein